MVKYTEEQILDLIRRDYKGKKIYILAPLVRARKGHYKELFDHVCRKGYLYVRVDGEIKEIMHGMKLDRYKNHDIELVVDKTVVTEKEDSRLRQSVATAMQQGDGLLMILDAQTESIRHYSKRLMCPVTGLSYREPAPHNFSFNHQMHISFLYFSVCCNTKKITLSLTCIIVHTATAPSTAPS